MVPIHPLTYRVCLQVFERDLRGVFGIAPTKSTMLLDVFQVGWVSVSVV